jgi:hypothetical protein
MRTSRTALHALFDEGDDEIFADEPTTSAGMARLAARTRAGDLAAFCLLTGQPPAVYRELTRLQRNEFVRLAARR